jgi:hypothetical protein
MLMSARILLLEIRFRCKCTLINMFEMIAFKVNNGDHLSTFTPWSRNRILNVYRPNNRANLKKKNLILLYLCTPYVSELWNRQRYFDWSCLRYSNDWKITVLTGWTTQYGPRKLSVRTDHSLIHKYIHGFKHAHMSKHIQFTHRNPNFMMWLTRWEIWIKNIKI